MSEGKQKPSNVKKGFGGGYRKPITDEDGLKWCNCINPNLVSNYGGRGQAWCKKCKTPYYH